MHWLTAICGFITLYALGGLLTIFFKNGDSDGLLFFGCSVALFVILGIVNEMRVRRKKS